MMHVNIFDLVGGISRVLDLVSTTLASHHQRTAHITSRIAMLLGLPPHQHERIVLAALLHDVGVVPLKRVVDDLLFEKDMRQHTRAGAALLHTCPLLEDLSDIVLYHHTPWDAIDALPCEVQEDARLGGIIHLADTLDLQLRDETSPTRLMEWITNQRTEFSPLHMDALSELLADPDFFSTMEMESNPGRILTTTTHLPRELDIQGVTSFCLLFAHVIDSRSPFTATHSTGVAHISRLLYELTRCTPQGRDVMFVSGLLHDIGKLGVPAQLIEKPGALTPTEITCVRTHAAISREVLNGVNGFEQVSEWGASHHERLDGRGYPVGLSGAELSLEARIVAVADVITAVTEDRPYRSGMPLEKALIVLDNMVTGGALDRDIVDLAHENFERINYVRHQAQLHARHVFDHLRDALWSVPT